MISSYQFFTNENVNITLAAYNQTKIPVDMVGIDERQLLNNLDLSYKLNLSEIEMTHNVHILQAYTALAPINGTTSSSLNQIVNGNLIIKANGTGVLLQEYATDNFGFCLDFFNPNVVSAMSNIFNRINTSSRGIWL